jgi:pilus assembly protein CpaB
MLKGKTPLIVAVALGIVAALLAYQTWSHKERVLTERWTLQPIVVAKMDITEGTKLTWDMIAKTEMPVAFVTQSLVKPAQAEQVVGQTVVVPLLRGDPILWGHFHSGGAERLSDIIRQRARAISLDISGAVGVDGWVRPADHVDILATFTDPKSNQLVTVTMMEDVVVIATGATSTDSKATSLEKKRRKYTSVTLHVGPEAAEILTLADELGQLRLTLRHQDDLSRMDSRGKVGPSSIISGDRLKEIKNPKPRGFEKIDLGIDK